MIWGRPSKAEAPLRGRPTLAALAASLLLMALAGLGAANCAGCDAGPDADDESEEEPLRPLPVEEWPINQTCIAPEAPTPGNAVINLEEAFPDLPPLIQPVGLFQAPDDDTRWFVIQRQGKIRVFDNDPQVDSFSADFLDYEGPVDSGPGEAGLLGMAFHPDFETNGEVYLSYTLPGPTSTISRWTSDDGGLTINPTSEVILLQLEQDFNNHNGGGIAFGPDGFLYIGFGDGGNGGDPNSRAQDTTNLFGAMLRIDVDQGNPYSIPNTNPFSGDLCPADPDEGVDDCPEIYAWGLRNPWRWSFDRDNGELWVADVGQNAFEEVNRVELGGNYGWDCREAANDFVDSAPSCATVDSLIDPVHEYSQLGGDRSITGGYVYRGAEIAALQGHYVFGDYKSGKIWSLEPSGTPPYESELLFDTDTNVIASFGESNTGELYIADVSGGRILKIVAADESTPPVQTVAQKLSETGCVNPEDPVVVADGVIPYEINAPFWSDGASKARWMALPPGGTMTALDDGLLEFPEGTVLVKSFWLNERLFETRLLMKHINGGEWAGYTYRWRQNGADAVLLSGGRTEDVEGQTWSFPTRNQCMECHTEAAGFALGPEVAQLNRELDYPLSDGPLNQLEVLNRLGWVEPEFGSAEDLDALSSPRDDTASLEARARAYLHTNCAQCHQPDTGVPVEFDIRYQTALADTEACDVDPVGGSLGVNNAKIIAPGRPGKSILLNRMDRRDVHGMPTIGSAQVDADGVELIRAWITSLDGCG